MTTMKTPRDPGSKTLLILHPVTNSRLEPPVSVGRDGVKDAATVDAPQTITVLLLIWASCHCTISVAPLIFLRSA